MQLNIVVEIFLFSLRLKSQIKYLLMFVIIKVKSNFIKCMTYNTNSTFFKMTQFIYKLINLLGLFWI